MICRGEVGYGVEHFVSHPESIDGAFCAGNENVKLRDILKSLSAAVEATPRVQNTAPENGARWERAETWKFNCLRSLGTYCSESKRE
jgi:hypothetical protein